MISLPSKRLSRVFSSTTVRKHQFFSSSAGSLPKLCLPGIYRAWPYTRSARGPQHPGSNSGTRCQSWTHKSKGSYHMVFFCPDFPESRAKGLSVHTWTPRLRVLCAWEVLPKPRVRLGPGTLGWSRLSLQASTAAQSLLLRCRCYQTCITPSHRNPHYQYTLISVYK